MRALAFSAEGSRFYTPGRLGQNEAVVWDTASGRREVLTIATPSRVESMEGATRSVDVTPDGQKLAVGNGHGLIVCDRLGKVLYEITNPGASNSRTATAWVSTATTASAVSRPTGRYWPWS